MRIVFVCYGNICRSPMAEYYLRRRLQKAELSSVHQTESAGLYAGDGNPAEYGTILTMRKIGIDVSEHLAQNISRIMVQDKTVLLGMTEQHLNQLKRVFRRSSLRIELFSDFFTGKKKDVFDPYGGGPGDFNACRDLITGMIDEGFESVFRDHSDD